VTDSKATAKAFAAAAPGLAERIIVNTERAPLFARHDIADTLADLAAAGVALPSGGALTIEPTEALTAIDVDSGTATEAKLRLTTNLEAAREIARQLRLRDLLGVIVVDFIRQDPHVDRDRVLAELRVATRDDRRAVSVLGYTAAGHVELLRTRRGARDK
jgi:Rne/Rng family ribonuclease